MGVGGRGRDRAIRSVNRAKLEEYRAISGLDRAKVVQHRAIAPKNRAKVIHHRAIRLPIIVKFYLF
ncbi:hypothetical protein CSV75_08360 [Sporosarcina sp. P18a]|nr:hypothetical protein CSV75_08360 [Sporosarcina sp. P18a]